MCVICAILPSMRVFPCPKARARCYTHVSWCRPWLNTVGKEQPTTGVGLALTLGEGHISSCPLRLKSRLTVFHLTSK
jgi:hypothetical protein